MFKVKIFDWSKDVLEVIETHWHNLHSAIAHAQAHESKAKVYNPHGEIVYNNEVSPDTYA